MMRWTVLARSWTLAMLTTLTAPLPAAASSASSAAEALFDDAKKLMASEKFAEACPKLQESNRLDPGGGTILLLARCHAKEGNTASAWSDYQEALRVALRDNRVDRQRLARTEGAALEPRLSKLVVAVNAKRAPPGLVVRRDGEEVGPTQWSLAIAVNPGAHEIVATAPGHATWNATAQVRGEGVVVRVEVPSLAPLPQASSEPTLPAKVAVGSPPEADPLSADSGDADRGSGQRVAAVATGVAGVALLGGAALFLLKAKSTNDTSNQPGNCHGDLCTPAGLAIRHDAVMQARTATIVFAVGAAAAVGGVVLWLTSPRQSIKVGMGIGPQVIAVEGVW